MKWNQFFNNIFMTFYYWSFLELSDFSVTLPSLQIVEFLQSFNWKRYNVTVRYFSSKIYIWKIVVRLICLFLHHNFISIDAVIISTMFSIISKENLIPFLVYFGKKLFGKKAWPKNSVGKWVKWIKEVSPSRFTSLSHLT